MTTPEAEEKIIDAISSNARKLSDADYLEVLRTVRDHIDVLIDAKESEAGK